MPAPKISAALNNCGLHCLTPEIRSAIENYARFGHYEPIPIEETQVLGEVERPHHEAYQRLLGCFKTYYELDDAFNWTSFDQLLKPYNAIDIQFVLGPVLRLFMAKHIDEQSYRLREWGPEILSELHSLPNINPLTKRYPSLSPDEIALYVANPLGFSIDYSSAHSPSRIISCSAPITTIALYHTGGIDGATFGGHFERTPNQLFEPTEPEECASFVSLLKNDNASLVRLGLELLKKHVRLTFDIITHNTLDSYQARTALSLTAKQVTRVVENKLLLTSNLRYQGIDQDDIPPETLAFMTENNRSSYSRGNPVTKYIIAIQNRTKMPSIPLEAYEKQCVSYQLEAVITPQKAGYAYAVAKQKAEGQPPSFLKTRALFFNQLRALSEKRHYFLMNNEWAALCAIHHIIRELSHAGDRYFNRGLDTYATFKDKCQTVLDPEHSPDRIELEKHRGLGQILHNILLGVIGLGVFYGIAVMMNKRINNKYLFFSTDSARKLDAINKTIEQAEEPMRPSP